MMMFSILIPAYKSRFLKECIDSILAQTVRDFEIVIVDDASPEDLYAIVSGYDDKRIRYYRNDKGFGAYHLVDNWNKCLQYAMGDYVICMGDDDMLAPTCLENYISLIGKYPGLNVYHTRTLIIDENSEVWQIQEQRPEYESGYSLWWHRWNGRVRQYIGDFLYDRAYLMSVGGFYDIPLAWASDDVTAVRAALEKGIANTKEPGFLYRENRMTISNAANGRIKAEATCLEKEWYENLLKKSCPDDEIDRLYLSFLRRDVNAHFQLRFSLCCQDDIVRNPLRALFWFRRRKRFLLSGRHVCGMFVRACVHRLTGHSPL
jgi:glycosyltransferase involved in cell wall biosynthesis